MENLDSDNFNIPTFEPIKMSQFPTVENKKISEANDLVNFYKNFGQNSAEK